MSNFIAKMQILIRKNEKLQTENDDLHRRLTSHIKGESIEHICPSCNHHFWNVDDEPIKCVFCGCEEMPNHPEALTQGK